MKSKISKIKTFRIVIILLITLSIIQEWSDIRQGWIDGSSGKPPRYQK